jgi:hypothetical protein
VGTIILESYTTILDSSSNSFIDGNSNIGGFVGFSNQGHISKSFSTGNIIGIENVGGFAGKSQYSKITNSYTLADVTLNTLKGNSAAGFIALNLASQIEYCYSTGRTHNYNNINLLNAGFSNNFNVSNNNYWNIDTSEQNTNNPEAIGLADSQMKNSESFNEWDFETVWAIDDGVTYPYLRSITYDENNPKPQ